jgi:hypothetical protein
LINWQTPIGLSYKPMQQRFRKTMKQQRKLSTGINESS